jgi:hypothetical protein
MRRKHRVARWQRVSDIVLERDDNDSNAACPPLAHRRFLLAEPGDAPHGDPARMLPFLTALWPTPGRMSHECEFNVNN